MTRDALTSLAMSWQIEAPFWGRLLAAVPRCMNWKTGSIALQAASDHIQLGFNPQWAALDMAAHGESLIKHELLHLLLGHTFRMENFANLTLFHIAADLEANRFIPVEELSPDAFTPARFPDFDLPPYARLETYYAILEGFWRAYVEGASKTHSARALAVLMDQGHPALHRHRYWHDIHTAPNSFSWWKSCREEVLQHTGVSGIASVPGLWEALYETGASKGEDWRRILGLFASSSGRTRLKHTLHRVSARYGTVPGLRIQARRMLLIAVDTSGSIATEELSLFFKEIDHLWRLGIEMTVWECDDSIRRKYRYTGSVPQHVKGRRGTRFDPVLAAVDAAHPDGLIFFTDGQAAAPQKTCRTPVLWMITKAGIAPGQGIWKRLPGKVLKMNAEG